MTSLSVVVWKMEPRLSSSCLSSREFVRLPLCASAMRPLKWFTKMGWTLRLLSLPVVP